MHKEMHKEAGVMQVFPAQKYWDFLKGGVWGRAGGVGHLKRQLQEASSPPLPY